jgi:electron transfer flavoprotein beta subunit
LIGASDSEIDAGTVARALQAIVAKEKPDLVLMGKQAVDGDAGQVGPMLAGKLSWPQATFAAGLELATDKASVTVSREVDGGVQIKKVKLPAVVTVDLRIIQPKAVINHITPDSHEYQEGPRYASLKGIMKAKKKPMDTYSLGDLGIEPAPVTRDGVYELPPQRAAGVMVQDVAELVRRLRDEAKVL